MLYQWRTPAPVVHVYRRLKWHSALPLPGWCRFVLWQAGVAAARGLLFYGSDQAGLLSTLSAQLSRFKVLELSVFGTFVSH